MRISHRPDGKVFIEFEGEEPSIEIKGVWIGGRPADLDIMIRNDLGIVVIIREPGTKKRVFSFVVEPSGPAVAKKSDEPKPIVLASNIWEPYQPVPPVQGATVVGGSTYVESTPL